MKPKTMQKPAATTAFMGENLKLDRIKAYQSTNKSSTCELALYPNKIYQHSASATA